jgi:SAM-dependent methyltransferase
VTEERASLIQGSGYLRSLYESWYRRIAHELPLHSGDVLELGSGGGFIKSVIPGTVTSEVFPVPAVDLVVDAARLPFGPASLSGIVGTNVLHHLPSIGDFLDEAVRTLHVGGRIAFIEPWPTALSRPIYRHLHHEPFDVARDWSLPPGGPLTAANGALPWIVFRRDEAEFRRRFPSLKVVKTQALMPLSYLLSGGLERAWPLPAALFRLARSLERPFDGVGMFALVVIERTP